MSETSTPQRTHRSKAAALGAAALLLALGLSGCGSGNAKPSPSTSPSATPYVTGVPSGVALTTPGTQLHLGQHAVVGWHPRQGETATLDLQVTRLERTTFDKSFQGWKISPNVAATTPYFARAVATNVSDTDLGGISVPLWARNDAGELVAPQSFDRRTFGPCHPDRVPDTLAPGASVDLCFVYLMSPGSDLASVTFQPQTETHGALDPITWSGTISTKVKPSPGASASASATKGASKGAKAPTKGARPSGTATP